MQRPVTESLAAQDRDVRARDAVPASAHLHVLHRPSREKTLTAADTAGSRPPVFTNRKCRHAAFKTGIGKLLDVRVGELVMRVMWRRLANGTVLLLGLALQCGSLSAATHQIVIERRAVNIPGRERVPRKWTAFRAFSQSYGDGIRPGETFTYRFKVRQAGTYWFHSHSMMQIKLWGISRTDGDRP